MKQAAEFIGLSIPKDTCNTEVFRETRFRAYCGVPLFSRSFRRDKRVPLNSAPRIRTMAVIFSQISRTITAPMEP